MNKSHDIYDFMNALSVARNLDFPHSTSRVYEQKSYITNERAFWVAKRPTERGRLVSLAVCSFAFRVSLPSSCFHFLSAKRKLEEVREARSPQRTGAKMLRLAGRCEDFACFPLG